ncbi:MAG: UDP-N-acetylglucosamine diphosphorylase [Opitutaceae bacterium]|nr:UDP-N-acetylglucosamine diphosphorylase [Opitutaceae bacterium]
MAPALQSVFAATPARAFATAAPNPAPNLTPNLARNPAPTSAPTPAHNPALNPGPTAPPPIPPGVHIEGDVVLNPGVKLPAYATIIGPAWIGAGTEIRPGAFIRGNVIIGANCVIGNACEFKNCLLMDGVQVPHFSYVGDSILGNKAHLGAGVILSNLRLDRQFVTVRTPDGIVDTDLRKLGALLGDAAEAGCNAVLQPGVILGKRALVMPAVAFAGYLPPATIARTRNPITTLPRRD